MPRPEINIEIEHVVFEQSGGTSQEVSKGEAVTEREDALKAVAKSLDREAVEELIGEDAEGVVVRLSKRQPVKVT